VSELLAKSLPSGTAEDGIHVHLLEVDDGETAEDGRHSHKFMLPDGTLIVTEEGGAHSHRTVVDDSEFYIYYGGSHTHKVVMPDGSTRYTSIDGYHGHNPQPTSTAFDGVHFHELVYDEATILRSLRSKDIYDLMAEDTTGDAMSPPASVLAAITKSSRECELRLSKEGLHFDFGNTSLTLACVVNKEFEHSFDAKSVTASWPAEVFYAGPSPVVKAAPGVGSLVCKCTLSAGVFRSESIELFAESEVFTRRMELIPTPTGWVCKFEPGIPSILLAKSGVPPKGTSRLPLGVEKQIPAAVRFWELEDRDQAQKALDWLVESKFATSGGKEVDVVDGVLAIVEVEKTTYEFTPNETVDDGSPTWVRKLIGCLPKDVPVVTPFAEEDWRAEAALFRKSDVLMLMDVPSQDDLDDVCLIVAKSKFVVGAEDTSANREKLGKLGRLFKLDDAGAFNRLFCTSVNVSERSTLPVYKQATLIVAKPIVVAASTTVAVDSPVLKRMNKATGHVRVLQKVDTEERYILGVVAEPDETDTQGDTQSADEVKKAAYGFLEDYRNVGLQHKQYINKEVKIVESYIAKADESIPGDAAYVKKGSWLMAVRVIDDELWAAVKSGAITGFSFGGYADRVPLEKN